MDQPIGKPDDQRVACRDSALSCGRYLGRNIDVSIVRNIHQNMSDAFTGEAVQQGVHMSCSLLQGAVIDQANRMRRLMAQEPDEIGIGHRRERIETLMRVRYKPTGDKEISLVNGNIEGRKARTHDNRPRAQPVCKQVGDLTDVSRLGRIEGCARLIGDPPATDRVQSIGHLGSCFQRFIKRDCSGSAGSDDDRGILQFRDGRGIVSHGAMDTQFFDVTCDHQSAGKVVGYDPKRCRHGLFLTVIFSIMNQFRSWRHLPNG